LSYFPFKSPERSVKIDLKLCSCGEAQLRRRDLVFLEEIKVELEQLIDTPTAAAILNVKPDTLVYWRFLGEGPPFVRVGRLIRYRREDLSTWIQQRTVRWERGNA
jgi:predicted DNA-binding transcriptional regulator AlpA